MLSFAFASSVVTCHRQDRLEVLGHEAFGGSACMLFPLAHTALAITTNNLTFDKEGTREVLRTLCREMDLPVPDFLRGGNGLLKILPQRFGAIDRGCSDSFCRCVFCVKIG
ncbi:hypothetical protein Naga_101234g1 [Nannochloropsis gaditana]|uniref:Uncharacterized protein n=1 Tax=Nannochloropsis gaditana TaxID=72520 RepID=W7TIA0_9STRA|nr:hypothetical protein Naga_101234g1 [Nannochloropsis gaditana]